MEIPPPLRALIDQALVELDQIEQQASSSMQIINPLLSMFPENERLISFFATLTSFLFFTQTTRRQIQRLADLLRQAPTSPAQVQEAGEDLSELMGRILEAKIRLDLINKALEDLQ